MADVWCPEVNDIVVRKGGKTNGAYGRITESADDVVMVVMVQPNGLSYDMKLRLSTVVSCYELLKRPEPMPEVTEDAER